MLLRESTIANNSLVRPELACGYHIAVTHCTYYNVVTTLLIELRKSAIMMGMLIDAIVEALHNFTRSKLSRVNFTV